MKPRLKAFAVFPDRSLRRSLVNFGKTVPKNDMKRTLKSHPKHVNVTGNKTAVAESRLSGGTILSCERARQKRLLMNSANLGNKRKITPPIYTMTKQLNRSNSTARSYLSLPSDFCSDILIEDENFLLEDESGSKWPVRFLHRNCGHSIHGLSGGWGTFARHHRLEEGNELVMELVQPTTKPLILKVKLVNKNSSKKLNCTSVSSEDAQFFRERSQTMDHERENVTRMDLHCATELPLPHCENQHEVLLDHNYQSSQSIQNRLVPLAYSGIVKSSFHLALEIGQYTKDPKKVSESSKEDQDNVLDPLLLLRFAYGTDSEDEFIDSLEIKEASHIPSFDFNKKSGILEKACGKFLPLSSHERKEGQLQVQHSDEPSQILGNLIKKSGTKGEASNELHILSGNERDGTEIGTDYSCDEGQKLHNGGDEEDSQRARLKGGLESTKDDEHNVKFFGDEGDEDRACIMELETNETRSHHLDALEMRTKLYKKYSKGSSKAIQTPSTDLLKKMRRGKDLKRGYKPLAAKLPTESSTHPVNPSYPSFEKFMTLSNISSGFLLYLPSVFCDTHLSTDVNLVDLEDENGIRWEVLYLQRRKAFSAGWRGFALDHKLKVGDTAIFRLVDHSTFKVTIIAKAQGSEPT